MQQHSEAALLLSQLVTIPSVFPQEHALSEFVAKYLDELGFMVEKVPTEADRNCIVATLGKSSQYICWYGHLDTVPADPDWQQDPFQVRISEGIAHGLGVADMKGGITAILLAAKYAAKNHLPMKIAFGVDEENISLGSHVLAQLPFFDDVQLVISAESGQIFDESQDFAINYGRKGRFALRVFITGKTAHAARSDQAVNAITSAAMLVAELPKLSFPTHQHLGKTEIIPYSLQSTTSSFSIPSTAELLLNVLSVPGVTSTQVMKKIHALANTLHLTIFVEKVARPTPYMEAYEVDISHPLLQKLSHDVFSHFNTKPGYAASVADENRFAEKLSIPVISIGPIGGGDHTASEWVRVSSLEKTVSVYEEMLTTITMLNFPDLTVNGVLSMEVKTPRL